MITLRAGQDVVDFRVPPPNVTDVQMREMENLKEGQSYMLAYSIELIPNEKFLVWCEENNIGQYTIDWGVDDVDPDKSVAIITFENEKDAILYKTVYT